MIARGRCSHASRFPRCVEQYNVFLSLMFLYLCRVFGVLILHVSSIEQYVAVLIDLPFLQGPGGGSWYGSLGPDSASSQGPDMGSLRLHFAFQLYICVHRTTESCNWAGESPESAAFVVQKELRAVCRYLYSLY